MRILRNSLIYGILLLGSLSTSQNILAQDSSQVLTEKSDELRTKLLDFFPQTKGVYVDEESGVTIVEMKDAVLEEMLANAAKLHAGASPCILRYSGRIDTPAEIAPQIQTAGGRYAALSTATDVKNGVTPIHVYDARPEDLRAMLDVAQDKPVYFTGHIIVVPERNIQA